MADAAARPPSAPRPPARPDRWFRALLAAAAVLFVTHALLASADPYVQLRLGDEGYYEDWARQIGAGAWLRPVPFFTSPLFAYWLAGLQALGLGSTRGVLLANAALGVATVWLTWSAARRLAGPAAALAATAILALGRSALVYQGFPDKTGLVLCLSSGALAAAAWALERPGWRRWLAVGAATGLAALAHPLALVLLPAVALHRAREAGLPAAARAAAPALAGTLLAVSPATLHNWLSGGDLVLVCSNGGHNLYIGNQASNATGLYAAPPFSGGTIAQEEAGFHLEAERRRGRAMTAAEVSAYWGGEAVREVAAAPGLAAVRFLRKLRWAFGQPELRDTRTYAFFAARLPTTALPRWDFGLPALLGLLGALACWRDRRLTLPTVLAALHALALSTFFVFGRYRLPLLVPLAILAGALLARLPALLAAAGPARRAALAAAALALAVAIFGAEAPEEERHAFADHWAHAQVLHAMGREAEAMAALERAVLDDPGAQPAVADAAMLSSSARLARGDAAGARRLLEAAARARPGDPRLEAALAGLAGLAR